VTDRLLHHSTVVSIQGEGYRLKDKVVFLILAKSVFPDFPSVRDGK
jgi:hypothetical protein